MPARDAATGRFVSGGGGQEIQRLIVRLTGDGSSYEKMLKQGEQQTKTYVDKLGRLHDKQTGKFIGEIAKQKSALKTLGRAMVMTGKKMRAAGRTMSLAVTAPLTIIGGLAVRQFGKFDNAMTQSLAIMEATTDQMGRMRQAALELSFSGAALQGPTQLAEAYFFLASAGKDAEQSMSLLPQVAKFATAGMFDMARATDLLTDAQSALGLSVKDVAQDSLNMARVSDVLVKANTLANASVEQFSIALTSKAGASLRAFNKDIEEGVAVLAALADQGVKAQLAGTSLDRFIRLLSKSSLDNAKAQRQLGFRVFDNAGKMRNLGDIVANLEDIMAGMSDQTKVATLDMLGFEARVQQVVLPLLGTSDAIKEYEKQLRRAKGITDEVARKQMKSFAGQMKILWNQIKVVGIEIGRMLAPALIAIGRVVKDAIDVWRGWGKTVKILVVTIAAIVAALGPMLIIFGILIASVGQLTIALTTLAASAQLTSAALLGIAGVAVIAAIAGVKLALAGVNAELKEAQDRTERLSGKRLDSIIGLTGKEKQRALVAERFRRETNLEQALTELGKARALLAERTKKGAGGAAIFEFLIPTIEPLKEQVRLAQEELKRPKEFENPLAKVELPGPTGAQAFGNKIGATVDALNEKLGAFARRFAPGAGGESSVTSGLAAMAQAARDAFGILDSAARSTFDKIAEAAREAWRKATEANLKSMKEQKKQMEQGQRVTEQFLTPVEKFVKRQQELQEMLGRNNIDFITFTRAMEDAKNELDEIRAKSDVTVRFNVAGIQAVRRGSAEATARLLAFRHTQSLTARPGVSQPELDAARERNKATLGKDSPQGKMLTKLDRLIEIAEESLADQQERTQELEEAGLKD